MRRSVPTLRALFFSVGAILASIPLASAAEPVDLDMVTRIRDEGFHRSQVMDTARYLTDEIGPRITGSPALKRANEWTLARLEEWGLQNGHLESYDFGRGWSFERCSVHLISPRTTPLVALPAAWAPGTDGPVRGEVMRLEVEEVEDLEKYKGQLGGKILFLDDPREINPKSKLNRKAFQRYDEPGLADLAEYAIPEGGPPQWRKEYRKRWELRRALNTMLVEEGALALVEISSRDNGIVRITGTPSLTPEDPAGVTGLGLMAEQYNWILRLLEARGDAAEDGDAPEPVCPGDRHRVPLPRRGPPGLQHRRRDPRARWATARWSSRAPTSTPGTPAPGRPTTPPAARW